MPGCAMGYMRDGLDRRRLLVGLSGVGASLLAGCGGSETATDPDSGTEAGGGTDTATESDPGESTATATESAYEGPDLDAAEGFGTMYPSVSASEHVVSRIGGATAVDHAALREAGAGGVIPFDYERVLKNFFGGSDRLTGSVVLPLGTVDLLAGTGSIDNEAVKAELSESDAAYERTDHEGVEIWTRPGFGVGFAGDTVFSLGFDSDTDLAPAQVTIVAEAVVDAAVAGGARYDSDRGYRRLVDSLDAPDTAQLFRVDKPSGDFKVPGTGAPLLGYTVGGDFADGGLTIEYDGLSTRQIDADSADVVEAVRSLLELEPAEESATVDGDSVTYTATVSADAHPWLFVR